MEVVGLRRECDGLLLPIGDERVLDSLSLFLSRPFDSDWDGSGVRTKPGWHALDAPTWRRFHFQRADCVQISTEALTTHL